jgi:peptide/nickel transport system substrate-binding protein
VPADSNKYNPGPQYRKLWSTLDVKKANEMLDKLGLAKKDAQGYRLRADGKGRLRIEITTLGGQFVQYTQIAEMIREQWKKIGIDLNVQEVERSLAIKRAAANEMQLSAWNNDGSEHLFTFPEHVFPIRVDDVATSGPLYAKWFRSAGRRARSPSRG